MRGFHRSCKIPPINALFLFSFCNELLIYFIIFVRVQLDIYIYTYIYMITAKNRRAKRLHSSTLEHWHFAHPTEVKWQVFLPLARHFIARSEGNKSGIVRSIKEKKEMECIWKPSQFKLEGISKLWIFIQVVFLQRGAMHVVTSPECGTENPSEPKTGTEKLFLAEAKLNRHLGTERKKI